MAGAVVSGRLVRRPLVRLARPTGRQFTDLDSSAMMVGARALFLGDRVGSLSGTRCRPERDGSAGR